MDKKTIIIIAVVGVVAVAAVLYYMHLKKTGKLAQLKLSTAITGQPTGFGQSAHLAELAMKSY